MSKAAIIAASEQDADYQAQAETYLAETNRILKRLASERGRHERRRAVAPSILATVKAILRGA